MHTILRALTTCLLLALPTLSQAASANAVFNDYVQAIIAEDWATAESFWLPEEASHAKRLGVEFTGVPLKVDCSSPLIEHRWAIRDTVVQISIADSTINDTLIAKTITIRSGANSVALSQRYFVIATPDGWRITSPIYHITRSWPEINTLHVRVRCPDSTLVNQFALDELNNSIDSLGSIFYFRPEHWITLNKQKIDYYLADRATIVALTGYDAHGMTHLPLDAVVTSHLPHDHEIVHAMLNFRLAPLPLYTLPALQEGIAVSYGGRWGKTPAVVMHLGAFVLQAELMKVDDILTHQGFNSDASDLSYALSGLLSRCLIESIGFAKYSVLYRRLSGPQQYTRSLSENEIRKAIEESSGQQWDLLVPSCIEREVTTFTQRGIDPVTVIPATSVVWKTVGKGVDAILSEDSAYYYIEVTGEKAGRMMGLCLESPDQFAAPTYCSRLFADQFAGHPYDSEIAAIVFDSLEAGVYDYRTDMLVAKFASGFSQGESIWDTEHRVVRLKVDKRIMPIDLKSGNLSIIW